MSTSQPQQPASQVIITQDERAYIQTLSNTQQHLLANLSDQDLRLWLNENPAPQAMSNPSTTTSHSVPNNPQVSLTMFNTMNSTIQQLQQTIALLQQQQQQQQQQQPKPTKVKVNKPKEFFGARSETTTFLTQCSLVFQSDTTTYADHTTKILYIASFLRGDAFQWFQAAVVETKRTFSNFTEFEELFKATFGKDTSVHQDKAFDDLIGLKQTKSCQAYATKFIQLAAKVQVDDNAKMHIFKKGLKQNVKLHLIGLHPQPTDLTGLITAAVQYDDAYHQLNGRAGSSSNHHPQASGTTNPSNSGPIPMDVDATTVSGSAPRGKLSPQEKQRRIDDGLCLYCGKSDCGGAKDVNKCATLIQRNAGKGGKQSKH
jgi:hypothetical protein